MKITTKNLLLTGLISLAVSEARTQTYLFPEAPENGLPQSQTMIDGGANTLPDLPVLNNAVAADQSATSVASGAWINPSTWDCNCVPAGSFDVTIAAGHEVAMNFSNDIVSLNIEPMASLTYPSDISYFLNIRGDWNNQGTFSPGISLVNFVSEVEQSISGASVFYDVNFQGVHDVQLLSNVDVLNKVYITDANLVTNDRLTLVSSGLNHSATLAPMLSGSITGKVGLIRQVNAAYNGWITLGSPFTNATVEDLDDDLITTGFTGSDYPSYSFVSVQTYDEAGNGGLGAYVPVANSNEVMPPGKGYYVYALAGNHTYDLMATPVIGSTNLPLSFTDSGNPMTDGLNLVANPYLSDINWDASGWSRHGIGEAIYVWDIALNQFRTYVNGYGVNQGSPIIRNGEAFWVQAHEANPEVTITELAKLSGPVTGVNATNDFLKMRITGLGLGDETLLAITEGATAYHDQALDAYKFFSPGAVLSLATVSPSGNFLAINNVPMPEDELVIPVMLTSTQAGTVTMTLENVPQIESGCMWIEDMVTGEIYGVHTTESFSFNTDIVTQQVRFEIHIGTITPAITNNIACNGDASGSIEIDGIGSGEYTFTWTDASGDVILSETDTISSLSLVEAGQYNVLIDGFEGCAARSEVFTLEEPEALYLETSQQDLGCNEDYTGWIAINYSGGTAPYSVTWNDGFEGDVLENITGGIYSCIVTDANGCEIGASVEILEEPDVISDFTVDNTVVTILNDNGTVQFFNNSEGAIIYQWNFDDGTTSTEVNPTHTYTEPGQYLVTLVAYNEHCIDFSETVIIVEEGVGVESAGELENLAFVNDPFGPKLIFPEISSTCTIMVFNLNGQIIGSPVTGKFSGQHVRLNIGSHVPAAIVFVKSNETGHFNTFKYIRE